MVVRHEKLVEHIELVRHKSFTLFNAGEAYMAGETLTVFTRGTSMLVRHKKLVKHKGLLKHRGFLLRTTIHFVLFLPAPLSGCGAVLASPRRTMEQKMKESGRKYWAIHLTPRSFAHTVHSFSCRALKTLLTFSSLIGTRQFQTVLTHRACRAASPSPSRIHKPSERRKMSPRVAPAAAIT